MKVWNIQYIFLLFVNPFIDLHSLTHGAVTVLAGIIMNIFLVTAFTFV